MMKVVEWLPEWTRSNNWAGLAKGDIAEMVTERGAFHIHKCWVCGQVMYLETKVSPCFTIRSRDPLSVFPSIVCPSRACHYYIEEGHAVFNGR